MEGRTQAASRTVTVLSGKAVPVHTPSPLRPLGDRHLEETRMALVTGAHPLLLGTSVQSWGLGWHGHIWRPPGEATLLQGTGWGPGGGRLPGQGP